MPSTGILREVQPAERQALSSLSEALWPRRSFTSSVKFDNALEAAAGIRFYTTVGTFFPMMAFYAARVGPHIEIISFTVDDDYWETIEHDPD